MDLAPLVAVMPLLGSRAADNAWLASVLDQLPAAVYVTDADGRLTYFNRAAAEFAGREPRIGADSWCISHRLLTKDGEHLPHDQCPMAIALREGRPIRGVEAQAERPDGSCIPFMPFPTPLFDASGRLVGGFNLLVDISERKYAEKKIAHLSRNDALTGLPNRFALRSYLAERMERAKHEGESFLVMRIDPDRFKCFNEEYGQVTGDSLLIELARRLGSIEGSFAARIGSDEFVLVSRHSPGGEHGLLQAEQVRFALEADFINGTARHAVSVSMGCARFPEDSDSETGLLDAANAALRLAKTEGRSRVRMFDFAEQERERERLDLRAHLRQAIETGAILLHYQPQFRADGSVVGFEALARWRHPSRGVVSPSLFIPAAEEGGLIAALGAHVLRAACREAVRWKEPLRISVNISPLEFAADALPGLVEEVLRETGLDPERLELEITEGVMVTDADRAMATLSRLRALGVRIALDDFGTGYSSLSYLHRFPLTTLKIDRSFVATLGVTLEAVAITRAIIQLGHALGIEVVAEGVETPEQLDFLICEGCDSTQGYLLGRPLDAAAYAPLTGGA
ncbi:putative bifunctional diguanylate cyclase/phosphodiesterase [Bosea sp. 2RAB26]|uniref:putative bifunctional diguanylate cyclase/phosphodiesterase n=1 Tax=Bosea sp. 2RAB26 TaxID=3237476 RepID=UPI003F937B69